MWACLHNVSEEEKEIPCNQDKIDTEEESDSRRGQKDNGGKL